MSQTTDGQIDTVMQEERVFPPGEAFSSRARISSMEAYEKLWNDSKADPEKFWGKIAEDELHWFQPFQTVLEWNEPFARWFVGGQTNVSYNCLDVHLGTDKTRRRSYGKVNRVTSAH